MKRLVLIVVLVTWVVIASADGLSGEVVIPNAIISKDFELKLVAPTDNLVAVSLDQAELTDLITEVDRRATVMLDLDLTPIISNAFNSTKWACGSGWQQQGFFPNCPETWKVCDLHLWRILTLTPDNAPLECTSLGGLIEIADTLGSIGLLDDASEMLAGILGVGLYDTILEIDDLVDAVSKDILATHPAVNTNATLPISLQDWLTDLAELPVSFGPRDGHPGVLEDSDTTTDLLTASFELMIEGTDNRLYHEGLDLCASKNTIELLSEGSSTTVKFDFDAMNVDGLQANPAIDLGLILTEHPEFVPAYTTGNIEDAPGLPPGGPGEVWQLPSWLLEYVVTDASYHSLGSRSGYLLYEFHAIDEAAFTIGMNDDNHFPTVINQPGWLRAWSLFGIDNTIEAQYLWESASEIVQQRLHEPAPDNCSLLGTDEGYGHARIQLTEVPVGLTSLQFIDGIRPPLEANADKLAAKVPGLSDLGEVDFYLAGSAGSLFLFFVHPDDLAPASFNYATPGFFADPSLQNKISTTDSLGSGDTIHEKIMLGSEPQTIFVKDEYGDVFRVDLASAGIDRISMHVSGECGVVFKDGFESPASKQPE